MGVLFQKFPHDLKIRFGACSKLLVSQGFERFSSSLDYKPIVDVRKVKPNQRKAKSDMDLRGAIVETAKYPTKPIEKMGKTEEQKLKVTDDLMKAFLICHFISPVSSSICFPYLRS